jgi:hypothetical protein
MDPNSELRERYLRLRQVSTELNGKLTRRLSKSEMEEGAKDIGMLRNGILVFRDMDESNVLFDYCLYNIHRDGRNAVRRFLEECPPAEGSVEREILEAKCRAWYSVFAITRALPGLGVEAVDGLRDRRHLMADVSLSRCDCVGGLMATRVIPFDGFIMTTGAGLPLRGSREEGERFFAGMRRVCFEQNVASFEQVTPAQEKELTKTIIKAALSFGASEYTRYEDPKGKGRQPRPGEPVAVAATRRVGRNQRCPCGSGRKFKVCCGR